MKTKTDSIVYVLVIAAVLSSAVLLGCVGCKQRQEPAALRLGYLPIAESTPLFVGKTEKIFEKHRLNVELTEFNDGPTVIAASLGGSVDGGLSGVTPIFFAIGNDKPIKMLSDGGHVVAADHPYVGIVVGINSSIKSVEGLKGKTIAVNGLKTIEDALLRVALRKANITESANVVTLPHPNMVPALERGTIDASMAIEPYIEMGLSTGKIRVLLGSEQIIPAFQISAIFFRTDFFKREPEVVRQFTAAYDEAIDFINRNPVRAKEIVATWTKTPLATASAMTLPGWSKELNVGGLQDAQRAMVENKILEKTVDVRQFIYSGDQGK